MPAARNLDPDTPSRPAMRYHGAKWRLAPWILAHFPPPTAYDVYDESHCGSASVLLRKARSPIEVVNDRDGDVVNFFRVLRDCPDDLIRMIELTPFARREWEVAGEPTDDPVERARRFYLRSYGSIAGPTAQWRTGWRRQKKLARRADGTGAMTSAARVFANVNHLHAVAARLRGVFIEDCDALKIIRDYDGERTLHYVDPPYPTETRKAWKTTAYRHEMTDVQHRELAAVLHSCRGMVVLSGYRCDLYDELFPTPSWASFSKSARTNGRGSAMETLWLNEAAQLALAAARTAEESAQRALAAARAVEEAARWPLLQKSALDG